MASPLLGGIETVAPLPEEWEELLLASKSTAGRTLRDLEHTSVEQGERNVTSARLAGRWLTQLEPEREIVRKARAFARLSRTRTHPFTPEEAEKVAESVIRSRRRGRSPEREAWLLARSRHLDPSATNILMGIVVLKSELGILGCTIAAPHRLLADYSGVAKNTVGPALHRLQAAGLIKISHGRDPSGRPITVIHLRAPLASDAR